MSATREDILDLLARMQDPRAKLAAEMTHTAPAVSPVRVPDVMDMIANAAAERQRFASDRIENLMTSEWRPWEWQWPMPDMQAQMTPELRERAIQGFGNAVGDVFGEGITPGLLGKIVYHGSPHRFDKFDLSKMGTGEGGQAFGWGAYVAESPGVAHSYKSSNLDRPEAFSSAVSAVWDELRKSSPFTEDVITWGPNASRITKEQLTKMWTDNPDAVWARLSPTLQARVEKALEGSFYTADLADEAIPKMLDWDKPLSQQPETVRNALKEIERWNGKMPDLGYEPSGRDIYQFITQKMGGKNWQTTNADFANAQALASDELKSLGIPGIRYLDAGSRAAGEGTRNYVVFDPELLKILSRE